MRQKKHRAACSSVITQTVVQNRHWFGESGHIWHSLPPPKRAEKARLRTIELLRAAPEPREYAMSAQWSSRRDKQEAIATKLEGCAHGRRCGSLACTVCRRAFARAQFVAVEEAANNLLADNPSRRLFAATFVPNGFHFREKELASLDLHTMQAVFRTEMTRAQPKVPFFGVFEISYEEGIHQKPYYQLLWRVIQLAKSQKRVMGK